VQKAEYFTLTLRKPGGVECPTKLPSPSLRPSPRAVEANGLMFNISMATASVPSAIGFEHCDRNGLWILGASFPHEVWYIIHAFLIIQRTHSDNLAAAGFLQRILIYLKIFI
jgi:hypothetical protein